MSKKLRPVLEGDWWLIGPSPDLSDLLPPPREPVAQGKGGKAGEHNAPVDHHIFQGPDGKWRLWGCVRATSVGRILYHWEADELTQSPWRDTREMIRCDRSAGECIDEQDGMEWLQSPYIVEEAGTYHMFYGGHRSAFDEEGRPAARDDPHRACQICLMTSTDGRRWTRHRDARGHSRVFLGPGETRDPCLIKIDGLWYIYYAGYYDAQKPQEGAGFVVRTSADLIRWSPWRLVHQDGRFGTQRWAAECPHVVFREGCFYLLRTENYYQSRTHVFRSEDPYDFGVGDASAKYVGILPCAAPEIYVADGREYVSSNHNPPLGTQLCRLRWEADRP